MASRYGANRNQPDYDRFRTGLTYAEVKAMLWTPDPDPKTWRHRSRGAVLGLWHSIKQDMWRQLTAE